MQQSRRLFTTLSDEQVDNLPPTYRGIWTLLQNSIRQKSLKSLYSGLLSHLQAKAARVTGNKLGAEQLAAARLGSTLGSVLVLGDRSYDITMARIHHRLRMTRKLNLIFRLLFEAIFVSSKKIKHYIVSSENSNSREDVEKEISDFQYSLP